jgi:hypothetical protein
MADTCSAVQVFCEGGVSTLLVSKKNRENDLERTILLTQRAALTVSL